MKKRLHKNALYIGLMSGTSMDGVDAALMNFQENKFITVGTLKRNYPKELRSQLLSASKNWKKTNIDQLGRLDQWTGEVFRDAALEIIKKLNVKANQIAAIGSHGQTIRHQPKIENPFSMQIGDPNVIAYGTKIITVSDFRRKDLAAGGEGAPLTPIYHQAMFQSNKVNRIVLNIGGISNITILNKNSKKIIGFDTGPGNTLLDAWIKKNLNKPFDKNGQWAEQGITNKALLDSMMSDPYFDLMPPKSTGIEYFNLNWLNRFIKPKNIMETDVQKTLTVFTSESIAQAIEKFAPKTQEIILCGGGAKNINLYKEIIDRLPKIKISKTDDYGIDSDYLEASAFAYLAKLTISKKPGNLTSVTGARNQVILGGIYSV
ncbi:MAG: anhydro-N-acetylmuramic acid kinase [Pseudomonadota bacterium]|nr:anhydro-N-acetylmuramic acid kinase [Pseudomonadota bacterium]